GERKNELTIAFDTVRGAAARKSGRAQPLLLGEMLAFISSPTVARDSNSARHAVQTQVNQDYASLFELYKHLHSHPELSFQEEKTSVRVAEELRQAGYDVVTGVGKYGVVGVLRNGPGPTVLARTDMDALPVKEQ